MENKHTILGAGMQQSGRWGCAPWGQLQADCTCAGEYMTFGGLDSWTYLCGWTLSNIEQVNNSGSRKEADKNLQKWGCSEWTDLKAMVRPWSGRDDMRQKYQEMVSQAWWGLKWEEKLPFKTWRRALLRESEEDRERESLGRDGRGRGGKARGASSESSPESLPQTDPPEDPLDPSPQHREDWTFIKPFSLMSYTWFSST